MKLGSSLQRSSAFYLTLKFAGQGERYRKTTLNRRLVRKPARLGSTSVDFKLETR